MAVLVLSKVATHLMVTVVHTSIVFVIENKHCSVTYYYVTALVKRNTSELSGAQMHCIVKRNTSELPLRVELKCTVILHFKCSDKKIE